MRRRTVFSLLSAAMLAVVAGIALGLTSIAATPPGPPANPAFESSAQFGVWANGGFYINNNMWGPSAGPQTIWAESYSDWGVQSDQPVGNKTVETYPEIQQDFSNVLVTSLPALTNSFTEAMPDVTGLDAEAADDVWLNSYGIEVMIWVDNVGQTPAGKIIGHATISGQSFAVWLRGTTYSFVLSGNETSGQTHILTTLKWLQKQGYVPASATLTQVDFGWEIASTGGSPMDFTMTNYSLHS
jgi:hypothetical protein